MRDRKQKKKELAISIFAILIVLTIYFLNYFGFVTYELFEELPTYVTPTEGYVEGKHLVFKIHYGPILRRRDCFVDVFVWRFNSSHYAKKFFENSTNTIMQLITQLEGLQILEKNEEFIKVHSQKEGRYIAFVLKDKTAYDISSMNEFCTEKMAEIVLLKGL